MNLKSNLVVAVLALTLEAVVSEAGAVTLQVDQVKQRYPWNGLVDIDYTIVYDDGVKLGVDNNLEVMLVDRDVEPAVTNPAITFLQAPLPLTEGAHRITWDANADGVTSRIDKAEIVMQLKHYSEAYMVIDVSGGSATNCYPVDFLNGAPLNGFDSDEYKGNKIVLRRIHPGSLTAGSPEDEAKRADATERQHRVALTQPFYIGIYQITQQQYQNVMGSNPSQYKDGDTDGENGQYRPVEKVSWNTVRGGTWPNGEPAVNSFMDMLIRKCKAKDPSTGVYTNKVEGFDLPTEFQWEYACRAGTTKAFNTTNDFDNANLSEQVAQLESLGRYKNNQEDGRYEISVAHTVVGAYCSNAWGLYDMHGNVWEWCRDFYAEDAAGLKQIKDPKGASSGRWRVLRGGGWNAAASDCRSAFRNYDDVNMVRGDYGFRLTRDMP